MSGTDIMWSIVVSDRQEETKISRIGLFKLPGYAGICLTYGTISVIQYGCLQWGPLYLVQDKKHSVITGNYEYLAILVYIIPY